MFRWKLQPIRLTGPEAWPTLFTTVLERCDRPTPSNSVNSVNIAAQRLPCPRQGQTIRKGGTQSHGSFLPRDRQAAERSGPHGGALTDQAQAGELFPPRVRFPGAGGALSRSLAP